MPKGSRYFGSHTTRIAINGSFSCQELPARFGHREALAVSVRRRRMARRRSGNFRVPYLANERDSAPRIVERDVVADLLQVDFGLWCEVRAHSLRAVFGHFGVLALQTI